MKALALWFLKRYGAELLYELLIWVSDFLAKKTTTTWDDEKVTEARAHKDEIIAHIKRL
jgi:hypothetical protein